MSDRSTGLAPSKLTAVLGPTNTGKTHLAVERMLGHASGMIGLPHGMKRDFMQRCEQENRAASDVIRGFMESYLARPVEILTSERAVMIRRTFVYPTLAAAALIGAVVVLTPGTSRATGVREDFAAMDADGDGLLTVWEFKRPEDGVTYSMSREPAPASPPRTRITTGDGLARTFAKLDANGDGRLDYGEYRTMRLGAARLHEGYRWKDFLKAGVVVAAGSDAPVEVGDPRIEFYAAVYRHSLDGFADADWSPEEAVTRAEALRMLTLAPAYAVFREKDLGTLEAGKKADVTAFDQDLMTIEPKAILTAQPVLTVVDGKVVFEK